MQSCGHEACQIVVDRALAEVGATGDLALAQLEVEMQTKDFSRFTHGQPFCGHRCLLFGSKVLAGMSSVAKNFSTAVLG